MRTPKVKKYSDAQLSEIASRSFCMADLMRLIGSNHSGSMHRSFKSRIKDSGIDISHWKTHNRFLGHRGGGPRKTPVEVFKKYKIGDRLPGTAVLRRCLVETGEPFLCKECNCKPHWNGKPLVFHVDHKDGDRTNCQRGNLRFLCPNCHSQTDTYGSRKGAKDFTGKDKGSYNGLHFIEMVTNSQMQNK